MFEHCTLLRLDEDRGGTTRSSSHKRRVFKLQSRQTGGSVEGALGAVYDGRAALRSRVLNSEITAFSKGHFPAALSKTRPKRIIRGALTVQNPCGCAKSYFLAKRSVARFSTLFFRTKLCRSSPAFHRLSSRPARPDLDKKRDYFGTKNPFMDCLTKDIRDAGRMVQDCTRTGPCLRQTKTQSIVVLLLG